MVEFGKQIVEARYPPWQDYYLDYNKLKGLLERKAERTAASVDRGHADNDMITVSLSSLRQLSLLNVAQTVLETEFLHLLDSEVEKVVLFFLEKQGDMGRNLTSCRQRQSRLAISLEELQPLDMLLDFQSEIISLRGDYRAVAEDLLRLVVFVELNVVAVRKILKKHDKVWRLGSKLSRSYVSKKYLNSSTDSHLCQLYHYEGISALIATIYYGFAQLKDNEISVQELIVKEKHRERIRTRTDPTNDPCRYILQTRDLAARAIPIPGREQLGRNNCLADENVDGVKFSRTQSAPFNYPQDLLHKPFSYTEEPILERLQVARWRLQESTTYVRLIAAQSMIICTSDREESVKDSMAAGEVIAKIPNQLNVLGAFLFVMNHYIVVPTTGMYAQRLGRSQALSGIIIGMTPLGALLAMMLYQSHCQGIAPSFKPALLFTSFCSAAGDILYALALPCNSFPMVLSGRFLCGFGNVLAINRRYIAASQSWNDRDPAKFVTAAAIGMATGPAFAAFLHFLPYDNIDWSFESAPGWLMSALWIIYLVLVAVYVEEPRNKPSEAAHNGEQSPLLQGRSPTETSLRQKRSQELIHPRDNAAFLTTSYNHFVLKVVLESVLSSTAVIPIFLFDWDMRAAACYVVLLALLIFPANLLVSVFSYQYYDREMLAVTLLATLVGILAMSSWNQHCSAVQYVASTISIVLAAKASEGPNMSLLSKSISRSWTARTFNAGHLGSEAGTFGKIVGNFLLSTIAFVGMEDILNWSSIWLGVLVTSACIVMRRQYKYLVAIDDDE